MDHIRKWLFPGTQISTVLRVRPLAITLFEKYGIDPWHPGLTTVGELCAAKGISLDLFFAEMDSLPLPDKGTDWKSRPMFHLVDFLTREHRQFTQDLLPAVKHALAQEHARNAESLRRLRYLVEEWPGFSAALEAHLHEEETFLFPKILQYEYCLRHNSNHADFSGGSVNVYTALQLLGNEKSQLAGVRRFLDEVRSSGAFPQEPGSLESRLRPLLEDLQARLAAHAGLETDSLFPMAKAVEKALMDMRISGGVAGKKPFQVTIPS